MKSYLLPELPEIQLEFHLDLSFSMKAKFLSTRFEICCSGFWWGSTKNDYFYSLYLRKNASFIYLIAILPKQLYETSPHPYNFPSALLTFF